MDLQKLSTKNLNVYIYGWKALARHYDRSERTLKRWHAKLPIPWEKLGTKKRDPVRLHVRVADAYYRILSQN